ncbi:MAG: hypothetical protein QXF12_02415 [Candidatus Aenigmatarchaeota archaeon]
MKISNISEQIIDIIEKYKLGNFISYDSEGNRTLNFSDIKYIFVEDQNLLITINENDIIFFLADNSLIEKKKNFFEKVKNIARYFNKIFSFKVLNKKFQPIEVFKKYSDIHENINSDRKKHVCIKEKIMKIENKKIHNILRSNILKENKKEDLTPSEKKWFDFLLGLYEYSSGGVFSRDILKRDEKEYKQFVEQAKRLAQKNISAVKVPKYPENFNYSPDERVKENQILYDYYSSLSELLDSKKDAIVGNIISRLADHYFFKIGDMKTIYNENSSNFQALVKFSDYIGDMIGFKKSNFMNKIKKSKTMESQFSIKNVEKNLFEWFNSFKFENIFLSENRENEKKILESRKSFVSKSIERSSEKMLSSMEKFGSPREYGFKKALFYVLKGIDEKEALQRAGLSPTHENLTKLNMLKKEYKKLNASIKEDIGIIDNGKNLHVKKPLSRSKINKRIKSNILKKKFMNMKM